MIKQYLQRFASLLCLSVGLSYLPDARAVLIAGPDGTLNATGTGAGAGWDYVGSVNGASGVYLGNYGGDSWVLTAGHVGAGNFTLSSGSYSVVPGSEVNLVNPDSSLADLTLFKIATQPSGLSNLPLAQSTVTGNVTMIGNGRNRGAGQLWYFDTGPAPAPYYWQTTPFPEADFFVNGYFWGAGNTKRWGTNTVAGAASIDYTVGATAYTIDGVYTTFDNSPGEGQGALGDSGGGVFSLNNNGTPGNLGDDYWELGGIITVINSISGQPGETAVYTNRTYSANIAAYQSQILSVVPEPGTSVLFAASVLAWLVVGRNPARRSVNS